MRVLRAIPVVLLLAFGLAPVAAADGPTLCSDFPIESVPGEFGPPPAPEAYTARDTQIEGDLLVEPGEFCQVINSEVTGDAIAADGSIGLGIIDSTVKGDVVFGEENRSKLQGSVVDGSVQVDADAVTLVWWSEVKGNLRIGPGEAFSNLWDASIHGNVRVEDDAFAVLAESEIAGDFACAGCYSYQLWLGSRVDGDMTVRGAQDGGFIEEASSIGGNLTITDSGSAFLAPFSVVDASVGGNLRFARNEAALRVVGTSIGGNLQVLRNTLLQGEVEWEEAPVDPRLQDNEVDANLLFIQNDGEPAAISGNVIDGNLICRQNDPPCEPDGS